MTIRQICYFTLVESLSLLIGLQQIHAETVERRTPDRQGVPVLEQGIQINPVKKTPGLSKIAPDRKTIESERRAIMKNERQLRLDQNKLRPPFAQRRPEKGSTTKGLYSNGFFPPTTRPLSDQNGTTGFGSEATESRSHQRPGR